MNWLGLTRTTGTIVALNMDGTRTQLSLGGAVRGITLAAFGLEKQVFIATSAWIDMGVDLSRSVVYWSQGFVDPRLWHYLPLLAVLSWAGSWMGRRILESVNQALFEKLVLALVFAVGLYSVLRWMWPPA